MKTIRKMKIGIAAGVSGAIAKMVKASGYTGFELSLANQFIKDGVTSSDWQSNVLINCFKDKGGGNYRIIVG